MQNQPMSQDQQNNKFDPYIIHEDDVSFKEVSINPDFYIHVAILNAQNALKEHDVNEGFTKYRQFIEHLEQLADARGVLGDDYLIDLNKYKSENDEYLNSDDKVVKSVRLANKKLNLILKALGHMRVSTAPLKA